MELLGVDMAISPPAASRAVSVGGCRVLRHATPPFGSNADPTGSRPDFGPTHILLSCSSSSDAISSTQSVEKPSASTSTRGMVT